MSEHNLPDGWRYATLRELTEEQVERVGRREHVVVLSSTKYRGLVPSTEFFKNRTIYSEDLSNYKIVRKGWFAYATNHLAEGSIGLQQNFDESCVSPVYTVFSCREGIDLSYLYRVLKSPQLLASYAIHEQASVNRRGAIRYADFAKIEITVPPLAEQQRIAEILDTLDDQIHSCERTLRKLECWRAGLRGKLLRTSGGVLVSVKEILSEKPRNGYSPKEAEGWSGILMLGLGCLTPDGFRPLQLKNAPKGDPRVRETLLRDGDLLMSRANTREMIGMVGRYVDVGFPCIYPDLMMRLRVGPRCRPAFLEHALRDADARRQIGAVAQGTSESMVKITGSAVGGITILLPSLREQDRILEIIGEADQKIENEQRALAKLRLLKQGLMDDLLTGRVRVGEYESVV